MMKIAITLIGAALTVAGFAPMASATPTPPTSAGLWLIDTATGDAAFAATAANGIASYTGTVGDYSVSISATGTTLAGAAAPSLELYVANATAGARASTLRVYYSAGAFGPTLGTYTLLTTGPASGGPVTSSAFLGSTFFATTRTLASLLDAGGVTTNGKGAINSSSYYLTLADVITRSVVGVETFYSTTASPATGTPDGGATLLLLGMALSGVGWLRKKLAA